MLRVRLLGSRVQGQLGAVAAAMGRPPAPSQPAEPLGLHQAASAAAGGSEDVAERVLQVGCRLQGRPNPNGGKRQARSAGRPSPISG